MAATHSRHIPCLVLTVVLQNFYRRLILCFVFGLFGWLGGAYLLCRVLSTVDLTPLTFGSHGGEIIGGLTGGFIGAAFLRSPTAFVGSAHFARR
jgi:hypothetical protein